jgi:tetratricopeptide (TPR) repeat protein
MDLGCLAIAGMLLLVVGAALLLFERTRLAKGKRPVYYPDLTTALIPEGEDPDSTPVQPRRAFLHPRPATSNGPSKIERLQSRMRRLTTASHGNVAATPRQGQVSIIRTRRGALAFATLSSVLFALTVIAALVTTAGPQFTPKSNMLVAIARFSGASTDTKTEESFASDLLQVAALSKRSDLSIILSQSQPTTPEQAEAERALLKADFLWWGEVGPTGAITATLAFAPGFGVGQQPWQRHTDPDTAATIFPPRARIYLIAGVGIDPLVPLTLALAHLRAGDYKAAATAASGAQATLDEGNGSGQIARFVEATADIAAGQPDRSVSLFGQMESVGALWPEAIVNRGLAYLKMSESGGARADADRAIASRDSSDGVLARANLMRARARYRSGSEFSQAISDLDEALRLDPGYALVHLDKAEVLYRQSQPDTARSELDVVLARVPDTAPAYRLLGLVRLMLGQPDDAQGALSNAARIYSDWVGALRAEEGRAQVAGDPDRAEVATEGILALNRELAGVYLYQGMALADKARKEPPESFLGGVWRNIRGEQTLHEKAIGKMQEAARLDPRRADIPVQMSNVYLQMGDTGRGAQALATARQLDPTAPEPYMALARLQEAQRNIPEAIKTITELTTNSQRYYAGYEELYRLYLASGDSQSANASLQSALQFAAQSPSDHLWRGKFLRTLGNIAEAEAEFRAALVDPDLWEAHVHLGEILQAANRRPEALAEFQQALTVQPQDARALAGAAQLLVMAGQVAEAETLFARLTSVVPQDVNGHIAYSQLLFSKGDIQGAIAQGKQAIAADPSRDEAHFYLGLAYEAQNDWPHTIEELRATVERNASHFEALIRLGRALYFDDRYTEVMQVAQAAIGLRADDPQPYRWRAAAQLALGDRAGALDSLGRSLQINPQYVEALALASKAYATQGDFTSALDLAGRATQADQHNPSGLLAAGEAYLQQGSSSDADQAFSNALATGLQKAEALTGKGRAAYLTGDFNKAIKLYGDALALDPNFAEASLYAGDTYAQLGNWDEALRQYSRAVQVRPRWAVASYSQGKAYLQQGDTSNALAAFERALAAVPNYADAWAARGITYRSRGQQRDAIAALLQATKLSPGYADAWLSLGLTYEELGDRAQALEAFTQAINTANSPATRQQAESGLQRVR